MRQPLKSVPFVADLGKTNELQQCSVSYPPRCISRKVTQLAREIMCRWFKSTLSVSETAQIGVMDMIKIEKVEVVGLEHAIRGMRNPKNSWDRSDSGVYYFQTDKIIDGDIVCYPEYVVGDNDLGLMKKLEKGGPVHAKYRRMIVVYLDITAPLYWWKEFDTYKVGTVSNSCSTMHKIHDREFTIDDFSCEYLIDDYERKHDVDDWEYFTTLKIVIDSLNCARNEYLRTEDKKYWWQMIQLLPSSYNQKRTIILNYEVLVGIYKWRHNHKLDEWVEFCKWIEKLPYSEIITGN